MSAPKVDQSGFQLDKKALTKDLKFPVKGIVEGFIDYINSEDLNHDGKSDVAEIAPYVIKVLPILIELAPLVDGGKFKTWVLSHDWIADKDKALHLLGAVETIAADAAKLAGK